MLHRLALTMTVYTSLAAAPLLAVEIIGHRGASFDAPENTLAAFQLGWQQQADAGELDIYLTKDGQIVVIHDANTKRTTGVDCVVAKSTLAELRKLDAGSWKGAEWKGAKLPTLAEALATIPAGRRMFIEIKCGPEVLPTLGPVLEASGKPPEQLVLIGFRYATMVEAKRLFPRSPAYWVVSYKADKKTGKLPKLDALITQARTAHLDGLDLDYKFPLDAAGVAQVKQAGLGLFVWTVDDADKARQWAAAGADGITTNRPGWLRTQLQAQ